MYTDFWALLEAAFERGDGYPSQSDQNYLIAKAKRLGIPADEYNYMCNYYHHKIMKARRREEEEDERREEEMSLLHSKSKRQETALLNTLRPVLERWTSKIDEGYYELEDVADDVFSKAQNLGLTEGPVMLLINEYFPNTYGADTIARCWDRPID